MGKYAHAYARRLLGSVLIVVLALISFVGNAGQIIAREQRGSLSLQVTELQAPNAPAHGVSMQAAHELSVSATQPGMRIDGLEILTGNNLRSGTAGDAIRGYIYLDAMPQKTLKTLALADDSSRAFSWSYRIRYSHNGQNASIDGRVASSAPAGRTTGVQSPAIDLGGLLDAPPPSAASSNTATANPAVAGLDVDALLGGSPTPATTPATPAPRADGLDTLSGFSPANAVATGSSNSSAVDDSLGNALQLRDQERERKAYVAQSERLRDGLVEQQSMQNKLLAEVSAEHQRIDQRRAEAERRRRAEAESSSNGRLFAGLAAGTGARLAAENAQTGHRKILMPFSG